MRNLSALAAQWRREAESSGLPCGNYTYSDPLKIENRYQSEGDAIREKYGSVANWRAWDAYAFTEINTGNYIFESDIMAMTGATYKQSPEEVLPLVDQSKILITKRW